MAIWNLSPVNKKSIEEVNYWAKDGKVICRRIGWRGGSATVVTADNNPPELDLEDNEELSVYEIVDEQHILEVEMGDLWDGCWVEWQCVSGDVSDEELEQIQEAYDNDFEEALEGMGWNEEDYELWFYGELQLELVEES